jgi:hypothetical protein
MKKSIVESKMTNDGMVLKQLFDLMEFNTSLPKQRSEKWYNNRKLTIGASVWGDLGESASKVMSLIKDKLKLTPPFTGSTATRFGCVMELVIQNYVEFKLKTIINEFGSLPGVIDVQSCSPDGVGLVRTNTNLIYDKSIDLDDYLSASASVKAVLFEFKCPSSREINGSMSRKYYSQCKVGSETIPFVDHVLFVEGAFRFCSLKDLGLNSTYTPFAAYVSLGNPIAMGLLTIRIRTNHSDVMKRIKSVIGKDTSMPVDFGEYEMSVIDELMTLIERGDLEYSNIELYKEHPNDDSMSNQATEYMNTIKDSTIIGCIPWKLFKIEYIPIERTPGYVCAAENLARTVMTIVAEHIDIDDATRSAVFESNITDTLSRITPLLRANDPTFIWPDPPKKRVMEKIIRMNDCPRKPNKLYHQPSSDVDSNNQIATMNGMPGMSGW